MTSELTTSWAMLMALGAFHGINPGMGWLFAVALGMQERRRGAVIRALLPLGAGHALAVAAAVAAALAIGTVVPIGWLRWPVAGVLVSLGAMRFVRHRHPRWAGMRVGMGGLTLWSFLMATAHGAGLMVVPVFVGMTMAGGANTPIMPDAGSGCRSGAPRHRPACRWVSDRDGVRGPAGLREARGGPSAPRVVQPRSDLGLGARRDRRADADAVGGASARLRKEFGCTPQEIYGTAEGLINMTRLADEFAIRCRNAHRRRHGERHRLPVGTSRVGAEVAPDHQAERP